MRAIREGIGHDGRVLFHEYRFMSDEDIESIIVFLRNTDPVKNDLPKTEVAFPVSLMTQ